MTTIHPLETLIDIIPDTIRSEVATHHFSESKTGNYFDDNGCCVVGAILRGIAQGTCVAPDEGWPKIPGPDEASDLIMYNLANGQGSERRHDVWHEVAQLMRWNDEGALQERSAVALALGLAPEGD